MVPWHRRKEKACEMNITGVGVSGGSAIIRFQVYDMFKVFYRSKAAASETADFEGAEVSNG